MSRSPPEPTHPPTEWVTRAPTPQINRPWREYDHLHPSSAKVKIKWWHTFISSFAFMAFIGTTSPFTSFGLKLLIGTGIRLQNGAARGVSEVLHTRRHVYLQQGLPRSHTMQHNTIHYNTVLIRNSSWTHSHRLHASFTLWKACEFNTSHRKCMTFH